MSRFEDQDEDLGEDFEGHNYEDLAQDPANEAEMREELDLEEAFEAIDERRDLLGIVVLVLGALLLVTLSGLWKGEPWAREAAVVWVVTLLYLSHGLMWSNDMVIASVLAGEQFSPLRQLWVMVTWPSYVVYRCWLLVRTAAVEARTRLRRWMARKPTRPRPKSFQRRLNIQPTKPEIAIIVLVVGLLIFSGLLVLTGCADRQVYRNPYTGERVTEHAWITADATLADEELQAESPGDYEYCGAWQR